MKRTMSVVLIMAMIFVMAVPVQARWEVQTPTSGQYYRIRYANNYRYLDIPSEGYSNNGTQLQLWDYAEGNQNQIFKLEDTGNGWHIVAQNGKIVEVRNSSHDNGAQVAQWGAHNLNCGLWNIVSNKNGSVSFQNRESGKYLNVYGGGDAQNGNKIVQWYNDGTIAMRFYLEALGNDDVISATFDRQTVDISEVRWSKYDQSNRFYIKDDTGWAYQEGNNYYVPSIGQKLFYKMEFLSPSTVSVLWRNGSKRLTLMDQIKEAAKGNLAASALSDLASKMGFSQIGVGFTISMFVSICQFIVAADADDAWNRFVDFAAPNQGSNQVKGVIVYYYYRVSGRYSGNRQTTVYLSDSPVIEYKNWTGSNFGDVCYTPVAVNHGEWSLQFK